MIAHLKKWIGGTEALRSSDLALLNQPEYLKAVLIKAASLGNLELCAQIIASPAIQTLIYGGVPVWKANHDLFVHTFDAACEAGNVALVKLLFDNGCAHFMSSAFTKAIRAGKVDVVRHLLNEHSDLLENLHFDPMLEAIVEAENDGHVEVVKFLTDNAERVAALDRPIST